MEEMIIKYISRNSLTAIYKGNEVAIAGKSYLPGYGSPDFVAYASTLNVKTPDGVALELLDEEKRDILNSMVKAMSLKNKTLEVEG